MRSIADDNAEGLKTVKEQLDKVAPKYAELQKDERTVEGRRQTDLKAKLTAAVADCDLLIIPRLTVMDAGKSVWIPSSVYPFFNLVEDQAAAVKAFVKAGKPVMVCFGPTSIGEGMPTPEDDVEKMFNRFGVTFGNQTVISESRPAASRNDEATRSPAGTWTCRRWWSSSLPIRTGSTRTRWRWRSKRRRERCPAASWKSKRADSDQSTLVVRLSLRCRMSGGDRATG